MKHVLLKRETTEAAEEEVTAVAVIEAKDALSIKPQAADALVVLKSLQKLN